MKKSRIIVAVLAVLLASGSAFAYGGGRGMGPGMGKGYGNPDCPRAEYGRGGMGRQAAPEQELTQEQAQSKLQEHVGTLKGYTLGEVSAIERPRGTAYRARTVDAAGNAFEFHVNPWGQVRGPFPISE